MIKEILIVVFSLIIIVITCFLMNNANKIKIDLETSKFLEKEWAERLDKELHNSKAKSKQIADLSELITFKNNKIKALNNRMKEVYFTSYYTNDACKSTNITGCGLTTADFETNEMGWYTYQGKVVLAGATWEGIHSKSKWIKDKVPRGWLVFSYYDETVIQVNGKEYQAIILDTCGASYWEEDKQRIDIFVSNHESAVGKIIGYIQE